MDNRTRVVDYGKDISDLRQIVMALQGQMDILLKRLEQSGALYNGAVAYSGTFVQNSLPKSYDGFNFGVDIKGNKFD